MGEVTIDVEGAPLRVMSNKMCDLSHYVDFDPLTECGIKERVRFDVLQELLGQYSGEEDGRQHAASGRASAQAPRAYRGHRYGA